MAECADGIGPLDVVNEAIFRIGILPRLAPGVLYNDLNACNAYQNALGAAAQVKVPTTFVLGERDMMTPAKAGKTLAAVAGLIKDKGALSVKTCVLLDKKARRAVPFEADYVGFEIPDEFVVGYGLDFDQRYRNLPEVSVLGRP